MSCERKYESGERIGMKDGTPAGLYQYGTMVIEVHTSKIMTYAVVRDGGSAREDEKLRPITDITDKL